jgi:hypothetical protein
MAHRHYGLRRRSHPRATRGPAPSGALSGGAIVGCIVAIVIALSFIAYEVTKLVAHAGNTTTSAPGRAGKASRAP